MSGVIRLTKKNHLALDNHFKDTLSIVHQQPISKGKKIKDYENEHKIILDLFNKHTNQECVCQNELNCLFEKYKNKEITIDEIIELMR